MGADGVRPRKDHRYVVEWEFEATVLTHWFAPLTSGSKRRLPAGMEFIVTADPPETVTAISACPVLAKHWEAVFVDEQERTADKYGGYSIVIPLDDLEVHCSRQ